MGKVEERRQTLLNYISAKGTVSTRELLEVFNIKKATLSEDISALKKQGIPLDTPRGYIRLESFRLNDLAYYEKITPAVIRQWMILLILSQSSRSIKFQDIMNRYIEITGDCSIDTLHKDLQQLKDQQYVTQNAKSYCYSVTEKFYSFIAPSLNQLDNFCYEYAQKTESTPVNKQLARVHTIATILDCGYEDKDIYAKNDNYLAHGKNNLLSKKQIENLNMVLSTSYQTNCLTISYHTNQDFEICKMVAIGLIVYSIEKNQIYLFCKCDTHNIIIPINSIIECTETNETNLHFNSLEFRNIFDEMFSISIEEPVSVRVRFANLPFIREKIKNLHQKRTMSKMVLSPDETEIIYTDTIRGLADFSSTLRQFGRGVIVDEPEALRQRMITSAEKIVEIYKEDFHYE